MEIKQSEFIEIRRRQSVQDLVDFIQALEEDGEIVISDFEPPVEDDESEDDEV